MEEIQDIKKKIQHLEYGDIKELREKICNVEVSLQQNNVLTELCTKSIEKTSETMDSVKDTMLVMSESIRQNNKVSEELASSVKSLGSQVNALDNKINEIDNKSKFDILDYLKKNWITIIIGAGIVSYLILK